MMKEPVIFAGSRQSYKLRWRRGSRSWWSKDSLLCKYLVAMSIYQQKDANNEGDSQLSMGGVYEKKTLDDLKLTQFKPKVEISIKVRFMT